jgi:hypothetical protein
MREDLSLTIERTECEREREILSPARFRTVEGIMSRQILNGWKEISSYIERSVRTVQRWEAGLGLPVYRPALKDRSAVVAFSDELDRWISRAAPDARDGDAALDVREGNNESLLRVLEDMSALVCDSLELAAQMQLLQERLLRSLKIHQNRIPSRTLARTAAPPGRGMGAVLTFPAQKHGLPLENRVIGGDVRGTADQPGGLVASRIRL